MRVSIPKCNRKHQYVACMSSQVGGKCKVNVQKWVPQPPLQGSQVRSFPSHNGQNGIAPAVSKGRKPGLVVVKGPVASIAVLTKWLFVRPNKGAE